METVVAVLFAVFAFAAVLGVLALMVALGYAITWFITWLIMKLWDRR